MALITLGLAGCTGFNNAPFVDTVFKVHCPTCRATGIDSIEIYHNFGELYPSYYLKIALDDAGNTGEFRPYQGSADNHYLWIGANGLPLVITNNSHKGDELTEVYVEPHDWGPTPFEDTLISFAVRDKNPQIVRWKAVFSSSAASNSFGLKHDTTVTPAKDGSYTIRLPKFFVNNPAATTTIETSIWYRNTPFEGKGTFAKSIPTPIWPPALDPSFMPTSISHDWQARLVNGNTLHITVLGTVSPVIFHRVVLRDSTLIEEDSGAWNTSTRMATFIRRGPGLSGSTGSMRFDPHWVQDQSSRSWFEHEPALDEAADGRSLSNLWRYFKEPQR